MIAPAFWGVEPRVSTTWQRTSGRSCARALINCLMSSRMPLLSPRPVAEPAFRMRDGYDLYGIPIHTINQAIRIAIQKDQSMPIIAQGKHGGVRFYGCDRLIESDFEPLRRLGA